MVLKFLQSCRISNVDSFSNQKLLDLVWFWWRSLTLPVQTLSPHYYPFLVFSLMSPLAWAYSIFSLVSLENPYASRIRVEDITPVRTRTKQLIDVVQCCMIGSFCRILMISFPIFQRFHRRRADIEQKGNVHPIITYLTLSITSRCTN